MRASGGRQPPEERRKSPEEAVLRGLTPPGSPRDRHAVGAAWSCPINSGDGSRVPRQRGYLLHPRK